MKFDSDPYFRLQERVCMQAGSGSFGLFHFIAVDER